MSVVASVDCGATSIRVCRIDLDAETLAPEVVHRATHAPSRDAMGHLRWDWDTIIGTVVEGLERCLEIGPLVSIGVDTWAVDYGLLDSSGELIGAPYCYRDHRTDGYEAIVDAFGASEMYTINGLQLQPFNTIFQLAYHDPSELDQANRLLWLPELIVHHLTGIAATERTSAGSSGLVDIRTGNWSPALLEVAGVDPALIGEIQTAGTQIGEWRKIPVSLVGGHDTASAVVGMGAQAPSGSAFVASGTWMLVGIERSAPDTSSWAAERNFTNEAGAVAGFRFLRNVTGFWILEQCRAAWGNPSIRDLVDSAEGLESSNIVDVDHPGLRAPSDMLSVYTELAGLRRDANPGLVTRSVVESVAHGVASVVDQLAEVEGFDDVVLFGGAARMSLLVRRVAELSGRRVRVGAPEATALGNAIVQGLAVGLYSSLADAQSRIGVAYEFDEGRDLA